MASLAPGAVLHQEVLAAFVLIRTDEIDVPDDRLRAIDPVWGAAVGKMMKRDGQDTPIKVCRLPGRSRWTLVAGAHRHYGATVEEIVYLKAEVVTAEKDERRLHEVRENLFRADLSPIDRAAFIAEMVAIHKRRAGIDPEADGRVASITARWQKAIKDEAHDTTATIAVVYGFTEQVANDLGFSTRTIENDLMLYRRLAPSIVERLREAQHPALKNATQLRALAKLEPGVQGDVLQALVGDGGWEPCASVSEALKRTQPTSVAPTRAPETKRLSTVIDTISRMSERERLALFQSSMLRDLLPAGLSIVDGKSSAEPAFPAQHVEYREEALARIDAIRELIDGLEEDDAVPGERGLDLYRAGRALALTRMTIAGNGFALGDAR
ncbi:MAG: hypothetical protein V3V60_15790 [Sphingomonas aquatilis]|uniref:hypothetical protein n=1 Tax=Sphingomonas aquatilis TaxID=93063 RepID=UPI002F30AAF0